MRTRLPLLATLLVLLTLGAAALPAQDPMMEEWGGSQEVLGKVVADLDKVPAGGAVRLAVVLEIPVDWYLYGNPLGPGTGKATEVKPSGPTGITFGPALYSKPYKKKQPELGKDSWVWAYDGKAWVYFKVTVGADVKPGAYDLQFAVDGLICKESCLPVALTVDYKLQVGPAGAAGKPVNGEAFEAFAAARPGGGGEAAAPDKAGPAPPAAGPEMSPEAAQPLIDRYTAQAEEDAITSLWLAILFGFIAGAILNVMPCVLPVVSIKVLSFVQQAGEDRGRVFRLGLAFAGGILFVFMILAGLAAFAGHGWGEQFQSTGFLIAMIGFVFAFSLAMFDLYTFELPGFVNTSGAEHGEGYLGAFVKGMLATVLATPCSGPFLGSTLAWVMGQPPLVIFTIFTSIGLGMAVPYVILTANPVFLKFVPKPGNWMVRFKELMGFLLLATVVYLLTIVRSDTVVWVVGFCLFIALACWIYGKVTGPWKPKGHRIFWRSVAAGMVALGVWINFGVLQPLYAGGQGHGGVPTVPFTLTALEKELAAGRTVVVDWTADWCPNCKFVEKTVLQSEEVTKAMLEKKVVFMIADITRPRPVAQALMNRLGSQSIPFLGIFPGDNGKKPWVLRDIYSIDSVLGILEQCP